MRRPWARTAAVLSLAVSLVTVAAIPAMAAPANDAFAAAHALSPPDQFTGDTTGATLEPGEPAPSCGAAGATVWFSATATSASSLRVSTFGSKFDTVLAAYRGSGLGDLTEVACNDDDVALGSLQSRATVPIGAGETVWLQIGGYLGATGALRLTAERAVLDNDAFADALQIDALPFTIEQSSVGADLEPGEPEPCFSVSNTLWYRLDPSTDMTVRVDTYGSDFDTVLGGYRGTSLDTLALLACNDDGSFGLDSEILLTLAAGETYYVQAGGLGDEGESGQLVLHVEQAFPPANDLFADAIDLVKSQPGFSDTTAASLEAGEPDQCDAAIGATVWFRYAAAASESVVIDTLGSDFDTVLAVYRGDSLESLEPVACNDQAVGDQSEVSFLADAGEVYHIQIGGFFSSTGEAVVEVNTGASAGVGSIVIGDDTRVCVLGLCRTTPLP